MPPDYASRICWARVGQLQSCDLNLLLTSFPESIRSRILRRQRETDRKASALSRWLLACCLGETFDPHPVFRALKETESGRPFLDGRWGVDMSISHSGDLAVCAVSRKARVGVDIEQRRALNIEEFRDVFHPEVWESILRSPASQDMFFEQWTLMEAVAKGDGSGLGGPVQSIRPAVRTIPYRDRNWHTCALPIRPDYAAHLAVSYDS